MNQPLVEMKNIKKSFGRVMALKGSISASDTQRWWACWVTTAPESQRSSKFWWGTISPTMGRFTSKASA